MTKNIVIKKLSDRLKKKHGKFEKKKIKLPILML